MRSFQPSNDLRTQPRQRLADRRHMPIFFWLGMSLALGLVVAGVAGDRFNNRHLMRWFAGGAVIGLFALIPVFMMEPAKQRR
jgi:hypothetical protein